MILGGVEETLAQTPPSPKEMAMDVVYPVGKQEPNTELIYSLRSLDAYVPHDQVFIVGYQPRAIKNTVQIPTRQLRGKWENSADNLYAAVKDKRLSDEFMLWNDDFFALRPQTGIPLLYRNEPGIVQTGFCGVYRRGAEETARLLDNLCGLEGELISYEMHIPMVFNKHLLREVFEEVRPKKRCPCIHWRSYYGNKYNIGGTPAVDVKWHVHNERPTDPDWLSSSPGRWYQMIADMTTRFPNPSKYER